MRDGESWHQLMTSAAVPAPPDHGDMTTALNLLLNLLWGALALSSCVA